MRFLKTLALIGLAFGMTTCTQNTLKPDTEQPVDQEQPTDPNQPENPSGLKERADIVLTDVEKKTLASQNSFAFNLFHTKIPSSRILTY